MRAVVPLCLALLGGGLALGVQLERRAISADLARARDLHGTAYVGSDACRSCHQDRHASWHRDP